MRHRFLVTTSSAKRKREARRPRQLVPHPDSAADVRAGLDEARRGDMLSAEESAEYLRKHLAGGKRPAK
jgi:hypothetical protein